MRTYSVEIVNTSRELTAKERIAIKDTTSARRLDQATTEGQVIIKPVLWAILKVHNEASDDKEYNQYILVDADGQKYVTGSNTFWNSFMVIYTEMKDEAEEWAINVYRVDTKNYKGKQFITCAIV